MQFTRRAALMGFTAGSHSRILGANDRINLGFIGVGERGKFLLGKFLAQQKVEVSALCDVFEQRTAEARALASSASTYSDHRLLLERKDLDGVVIATPDHWHASIAIDSANAGKDIYVEKPLTLRIEEGMPIVKAVRLNQRVCQVGMQRRSAPQIIEARQRLLPRLGKVLSVRTWWNGNTAHLRRAPDSWRTQPSGLDWGRFLGPATWREWDPQQFFNFRAFLDFGGGMITDLFTHLIDAAHMLIGEDIPQTAAASGGVFHYKDGRTAPDTIHVLLGYPSGWNATYEGMLAPGAAGAGIEINGTEGRLSVGRKVIFTPAEGGGNPESTSSDGDQVPLHVQNFLDCMRSRQTPNGDVLIGHRAAQASHLATLAYMEKRQINFNPATERLRL
ncbi:MAG: Gfo/Idh/MocA family oxidoreductase [Acidobacteria bacterium]|nr:Gfo/Idh/MocA family oxidoreductase [Acidobacteriota bacterium]